MTALVSNAHSWHFIPLFTLSISGRADTLYILSGSQTQEIGMMKYRPKIVIFHKNGNQKDSAEVLNQAFTVSSPESSNHTTLSNPMEKS